MIFGKRGLSAMACMGLIGGLLVGGTSVAHAAVGDKTVYDVELAGDTSDLKDIVVGPDGLLWVFEDSDDVFVRVNASGEVVGVVNAEDCAVRDFKISYADSLWCFHNRNDVTRFYADGRRAYVALPASLADSPAQTRSAAVGPDGQLWVSGVVRTATLEISTNDDLGVWYGNTLTVTKVASAVAAPMSTSGIFGSTITLGCTQGGRRAEIPRSRHGSSNGCRNLGDFH